MAVAEEAVLRMARKPEYIRCFKDDAVMQDIPNHPGWIYCPLCKFITQKVGYDSASVRRDFDEMFEEYQAEREAETPHVLYPNGDHAPLIRQDKQGGGGSSGRRRSKPQEKKPAPKWTLS